MILTGTALVLSAAGAWALPKCPGSPMSANSWAEQNFITTNWVRCVGEVITYKGHYKGEIKNGLSHGYGVIVYFSGHELFKTYRKYTGQFRNDTWHGLGIAELSSGGQLEGIFKNGTFQYSQKTPESSKQSLLAVAFNKLSQSQRRQIQLTLSKLDLYASKIDGVYGKGTAAALASYNKKYLKDFDLTKAENVGNLIDSVLALEAEKAKPPAVTEAKPDYDEVLEAASGSGFAVSSDGYMITNNHVIEGCQEVAVYDGGRAVPVTVITYDLQNDLALLKGDFTPKTVFAMSDEQPELLQDVYVAGYPFGNEISSSIKVTKGIISSLTGIGNNFSNIQIDAALQVGNSGGPILDEWGNVVGVAVSKLDAKYMYDNFGTIPENTNFGIKANVVRSVLDSNGVSSPSPSTNEITKSELGTRITGGTYYVSCLMTLAQIEFLRTKKVMFENLD
jgi:S1-C subfamily serine protease